jgi:cation transport protein ChaC
MSVRITRAGLPGAGSLGTCREYFDPALGQLAALGIRDAGMERLRTALR